MGKYGDRMGPCAGGPNTVDLVEARSQLEVIAARLAAERRTAEDIEGLRGIIEAMASAADDRATLAELDLEFHLGLARASHSDVLAHLLDSVRILLKVWISRVLASKPVEELHGEYVEHGQILDAVADKDADLAEVLMREAMRKGQRSLAATLQAASRDGEERTDRLLVMRGPRQSEERVRMQVPSVVSR